MFKATIAITLLFLSLASVSAKGEILHIATASNFAPTLEKLSESFNKETGHKIIITNGATGALYTQIIQGAPFDILLSADVFRAQKLEEERVAIRNSRFTYAIGRLALWYPSSEIDVSEDTLYDKNIKHLAIANPDLAPYGLAAKETLIHLSKWQDYRQKLLLGNNISQAFNFTSKSHNTAGFVALSQLLKKQIPPSKYWIIPDNYYTPIKQQAVLLKDLPEGLAFMEFLKSNTAKQIILADGYKTEAQQ